jgi:hypothetical protein
MRKRLGIVAVGVAALLVVAVGASLVSASSGLTSPKTLTFTAKNTQANFIDNKPTGNSVGDEFAFTEMLTKGGKHIGFDGVHCVVTGIKPNEAECEGTFSFTDGSKLTAQTLFHLTNGPQTVHIAITGGSGIYQNAGGFGTSKSTSQNTSNYTMHVIIP